MNIIEKLDKNFLIPKSVHKKGIKYYNPRENKYFKIHGVFYEDGCYRRMPAEIAKSVSEGVYSEHTHTAGGRIRFITDSPYVAIRADMHNICKMSHFSLEGSAGFDLYVREFGSDIRYEGSFIPPYDIKHGFEGIVEFDTKKTREITINMPSYAGVKEVFVGLDKSARIVAPEDYLDIYPFVYYGSSITQGACASRPGNTYQNIIARKFDVDYINLGFSGNAKAEESMSEYIKKLQMSVFIYDYDYNAPDTEYLRQTHERMFNDIRESNPELPVIMMSRPNYKLNSENSARLEIIKKTFENAVSKGDKNVYLIEGPELMKIGKYDCIVDYGHPNDLGFYSMAQTLIPVLEKIL